MYVKASRRGIGRLRRKRRLDEIEMTLGCIATVVPVLTSIYIADEDPECREQEDLQQFSAKAVMRTELVTNQAFARLAEQRRLSVLLQPAPLNDKRQDIQIGRNGNYVSIDAQSYVHLTRNACPSDNECLAP